MYNLNSGFPKGNHTLIYPVNKLEITINKNEQYRGNLTFQVSPACEISGFLCANNYRMQFERVVFREDKIEIEYCFNGTGLTYDDQIKGEIFLITNIGEYSIEFEVTVVCEVIQSSIGPIKNLFHFVNLARSDWEEAVSVFYMPRFEQILCGADSQYKSLYRGISCNKFSESAMEEFLICIRKKQPVSYSLLEEQITLKDSVFGEQFFVIRKENWGYTRLIVRTDAEFIELPVTEISEKQFEAGQARIPFLIQKEKLHAGRNFGKIFIVNGLTEYCYEVVVDSKEKFDKKFARRKKINQLYIQLIEEHIYCNLEPSNYHNNTVLKEVIDKLLAIAGNHIMIKLYQSYVLLLQNRDNEAKWILRYVDEMWEHNLQGASEKYVITATVFRKYIDYIRTEDVREKEEIVSAIRDMWAVNNNNLAVFLTVAEVDEVLKNSIHKKMRYTEEMYQRGCRSPLLYLMAYRIFCESPAYLDRLEGLGLQVVFFAMKYHLLTEELVGQINHLAMKSKQMTKALYKILCKCYEFGQSTETLHTICTLLIKGGYKDSKFFEWYKLGVEKELRITRLYEYYLLSIDLNEKELLPKMLLMYFSYSCDLDYVHTAYLYANVYRHRESIPKLYESYKENIEHFVYNQVNHGRVSDDLVYLYNEVVSESMVDKEFAEAMLKIMFTHKVTVNDLRVKNVVRVQKKGHVEYKCQVVHGVSYIPIYDEEYAILLETENGNRYEASIPYSLDKLFSKRHFWPMVEAYAKANIGACVYFYNNNHDLMQMTEGQRRLLIALYECREVETNTRTMVGTQLMKYYYETDRTAELDEFLLNVHLEFYSKEDRAQAVKYMIIRELNEKAFQTVRTYGYEGIAPRFLIQLFQYAKDKYGETEQTFLLATANYIFSLGKYEESVLEYLIENYEGNLKQMRIIWEKATQKMIEADRIAERIIKQTLYSGAYVAHKQEVFLYYYQGKPDASVVNDFLAYMAYQYVTKGQIIDEKVFEIMLANPCNSTICKIAIIYYYTWDSVTNEGALTEQICQYIRELLREGVYFPFFNEYAKEIPELLILSEKTFVEYQCDKDAVVTIHYRIGDGDDNTQRSLVMHEKYEGYYCETFDLFFGERLQYYITEECNGVTNVTASGVIEKSDIPDYEVESRYNLLNQMEMSTLLNERDSVCELAYDYARLSFFTDKIFGIR